MQDEHDRLQKKSSSPFVLSAEPCEVYRRILPNKFGLMVRYNLLRKATQITHHERIGIELIIFTEVTALSKENHERFHSQSHRQYAIS